MPRNSQQLWATVFSTLSFTVCFAAWTIFSIIGIKIKENLGLSDTQFGLLIGTPILTGSLIRVFLGVWSEQYGGRIIFVGIMLAAALATWLLTFAQTYPQFLLAALGVGIAGGSFAVGVTYVSKFYETKDQGTALGIFGAGNIGAAVTKFFAPFIMVAYGWETVANIWALALVAVAAIFWMFTKDDPETVARRRAHTRPQSAWLQLEPLKNIQVWRFSLYYFFVFGAFVALALWLPHYLMGAYALDIKTAGMLAVAYSVPASLFRIVGGRMSDKYGARFVMYLTFGVCAVCTFLLAYPSTRYIVEGINGPIEFSIRMTLPVFLILVFTLGFFMSLGKAAVYKHIPVYYPKNVGAVGGLVGMMGGLGGFILPFAFGYLNDVTGIWTSCFMLLFVLVAGAFLWMHMAILRLELKGHPDLKEPKYFPEMAPQKLPHDITGWNPEDLVQWEATGKKTARRNLWISVPALLLAFSVWMVWSVITVNLPKAGFTFTTDQLFWLTALPALSGAFLRIAYAFVVPIFGGRRWTVLSTASLLVPAIGIGLAVQDPQTPYGVFLALALLCGLGGGNFASSMSNISYFYPKREKGHALAINAGLGNLGVSVLQFLAPIAITMGLFGYLAGDPQVTISATGEESRIWLQNAGYIWVPFIIAAATAAWFGMNDISDMKASFASQMVIFKRKHNWIMCFLYIGTFGSFIGFSAGFPLLAKTQFPEINSMSLAFIGPLVGALARAGSGWISDRFGGGRVTIGVFIVMILAVLGVLYFLDHKEVPNAFYGFFGMFLALFAATGVGNASTFQMIPTIFLSTCRKALAGEPEDTIRKTAEREAAATIGFSSAIGAFGGFFIPKSYGTAIAMTGAPDAALKIFAIYYIACLAVTWWFYCRRGAQIRC